jgi:hypothetical protein
MASVAVETQARAVQPAPAKPVAPDTFERGGRNTSAPPVAGNGATAGGRPLGPWSFAAPTATTTSTKNIEAVAVDPPSGPALGRALAEAVARCVRSRPPSDDAFLVDKLASFVFSDTARDFVAAVRRGEEPELTEVPTNVGSLAPADTASPHQFYMVTLSGKRSYGGMASWRGDIFPEGFYRTRATGDGGTTPAAMQKEFYVGANASKLFEQPYFRWEDGRYEFRPGDGDDNANVRIVEHLAGGHGAKVSLWRGTQEAYDTPAELRVVGDDGRYGVGSMSAFGDDFGSVLTTPDRGAAEGWANPTLVRFDFSVEELKQLARDRLLYAGIEFSYVEVALLYDRDPRSPRGHDSVDRMTVVGNVTRPDTQADTPPAPRSIVDNPDAVAAVAV